MTKRREVGYDQKERRLGNGMTKRGYGIRNDKGLDPRVKPEGDRKKQPEGDRKERVRG